MLQRSWPRFDRIQAQLEKSLPRVVVVAFLPPLSLSSDPVVTAQKASNAIQSSPKQCSLVLGRHGQYGRLTRQRMGGTRRSERTFRISSSMLSLPLLDGVVQKASQAQRYQSGLKMQPTASQRRLEAAVSRRGERARTEAAIGLTTAVTFPVCLLDASPLSQLPLLSLSVFL